MSLPSARGGRGARNGSHRPSPDALANERHFLRQSIEDLEEQRAAGEVDEEDFAVLDSRYGRRLAEVEAATADLAARDLAAHDLAAHRQAGTADDPEVSVGRLDGVPPASPPPVARKPASAARDRDCRGGLFRRGGDAAGGVARGCPPPG